ncbi:MAG TPA: ATP-binding protein [Burkholderiales bacterium]|nr:ATP-binding protein [Burkholderiales bacterium]
MRLAPYLVSAAAVAVVGFAAHALTRFVPLPHVSILFLAAVITSAALWGFGPSVFAALLSVGAASFFFYSPIFSFRVVDPQHLADLAVFVIVAAFTSRLAASVRARALDAQRRQETVSRLLAFNERVAASADERELNASILQHLAPALGNPIHLLLPASGRLAPAASLGDGGRGPSEQVCQAAERVMAGDEAQLAGWRLEPLATARVRAGIVAVQGAAFQSDPEYARALLAQAALALERARLRREIADARIKAQGEALREALINSVSHDLQTPLAAILGSATALETFGEHGAPRARRELVAAIRDEAERLASYIDNVLDLTRIRAGQVAPRLELVELPDIVNAALRRKQKALDKCMVEVALPPDLPMLRLDLFLMEHALANVLDNAAKYARAGTKIRIAARMGNDDVVLDVTDDGAGIRAEDLARVFDAFYRGAGPEGRPASGTGLGLAICRAFVEANHGSVEALSAGIGRGATVRLRLPIPERVAEAESAVTDD